MSSNSFRGSIIQQRMNARAIPANYLLARNEDSCDKQAMNFELMLIIAPIFLLIILGHGLRRGGIPSFEFWNLNDKLVYWCCFRPCCSMSCRGSICRASSWVTS